MLLSPEMTRRDPELAGRPSFMLAQCLVWQLRDISLPLLMRELPGCGADPFGGVVDVQIPQPHSPVDAPAGQRAATGGQRPPVDSLAAARQRLAEQPGMCEVGDIPQSDRAVVVAAGQHVII